MRAVRLGQRDDEVVDAIERPSTFSPDGSVTVTVVGGTFSFTGAAPRPAAARHQPGLLQRFSSANFAAKPFRSPVAEWHDGAFRR